MSEKGYKVLEHLKGRDLSNNRYIDVIKEWDELGFIDYDLGEELHSIIESDDYILGLHRTGTTRINPDINDYNLRSIFMEGLINNGDMMSGSNNGQSDIEKTVILIKDPLFLSIILKNSDSYKKSDGCVVVKIPKSYLGKKAGPIMPIYYQKYGINRLCPEFIYGYIPVSNHKAFNIIRNPNYKDEHYIINENSIYDDSVSIIYPNLPIIKQISLKEKYDIICKAYIDTLKKYNDNQAITALYKIINENNFNYFTGSINRKLLSQHILFSDIKKILCYGLNSNYTSVSELINQFHKTILNEINIQSNKNTI